MKSEAENQSEVQTASMNELIQNNENNVNIIANISPVAGPSTCPNWKTPEKRNILYYEDKEDEGFNVPTPFKKCLVIPRKSEDIKTPKQKRKIFPAVVSSEKYREFYEKEINKKENVTQRKKAKSSHRNDVNEKEDTSDSNMEISYADEDLDFSEPENLILADGQYVIIKYEDKYYPGVILKHDYDGAEVQTMESAGINSWKWPVKEDVLYYFKEDIILTIKEPQLKNNRGCFDVPEMK
ncbi:uncharacterized protein [Leptinotarsa decemlineata]|uniref:uncharacterized protein n=1 Tax=Leptinotarsa decemlineata TaxID=7539 RepID=UPI003D306E32